MKLSLYNQVPSVNSHLNVHGTFIPKNFTVTHFTSLKNKITVHKSRSFTPRHYTSLIYAQSPHEFPCL